MSTIVTRSGKGAPLTNTEVDANFTNLDNDKLETSVWTSSEAASITAEDTAKWDSVDNKASIDDATALSIALG
jgi:hypothetical protein